MLTIALDQQVGQLYELMKAIKNPHGGGEHGEGEGEVFPGEDIEKEINVLVLYSAKRPTFASFLHFNSSSGKTYTSYYNLLFCEISINVKS